jgi:cytochrome c-type biogenesis protein CcmE
VRGEMSPELMRERASVIVIGSNAKMFPQRKIIIKFEEKTPLMPIDKQMTDSLKTLPGKNISSFVSRKGIF